jgi:hypothetical protein
MYTVRFITFNLDHEMNFLHFISNGEDLISSFACPSAKFSPLVFLWDSLNIPQNHSSTISSISSLNRGACQSWTVATLGDASSSRP